MQYFLSASDVKFENFKAFKRYMTNPTGHLVLHGSELENHSLNATISLVQPCPATCIGILASFCYHVAPQAISSIGIIIRVAMFLSLSILKAITVSSSKLLLRASVSKGTPARSVQRNKQYPSSELTARRTNIRVILQINEMTLIKIEIVVSHRENILPRGSLPEMPGAVSGVLPCMSPRPLPSPTHRP